MTELLGRSLDEEITLASIASLALPHDGGWSILDLLTTGCVRRVPVVHPDPALQALVRELDGGWPPQRDGTWGAPLVTRTRKPEVIDRVTPELIERMASGRGACATLMQLGIGSMLVVPLLGATEVFGAITFVSPIGGHAFGHDDVPFAEEVAHRAAQAIQNARQYSEARQAERDAEEANRAKLTFLASLSHELRTPLNAINGYAQLLMEGTPGSLTRAQFDQVRRIQRNERHLLELVDAVLGFARLDTGRASYQLERVPLSLVLTELDAIVQPVAAQKGVELHVAPPPRIAVLADRRKLCQILVNLVNNAVKFSMRGTRVTVTADAGNGLAALRVRDAGVGMTAAQLALLFQPFTKAHQPGTDGEEGTGLGLAISRRLARDMGGDIVAESTPGQGSTFTLTVPIAAPAAATRSARRQPA